MADRPGETPAAWNVPAGSRFPDVIVQADTGYLVFENPLSINNLPVGLHGWPPESSEMHGIFLASGPRLPAGMCSKCSSPASKT